jgi:predicted amidophosphoribosyltransferase
MATENQKRRESESVRIYKEKKTRVKNVKRALAVLENRDVSDTLLVDEILEEGLTKREKKLGL